MNINNKRAEIDKLDTKIARLLTKRLAIAREIAMLKLSAGIPVADRHRENEVLRRVTENCDERAVKTSIVEIYRHILTASRRVQTATIEQISEDGAQI